MVKYRQTFSGRMMMLSAAMFFIAFGFKGYFNEGAMGTRLMAGALLICILMAIVAVQIGFENYGRQVTFFLCVGAFVAFLALPTLFKSAASQVVPLICFFLSGASVVSFALSYIGVKETSIGHKAQSCEKRR